MNYVIEINKYHLESVTNTLLSTKFNNVIYYDLSNNVNMFSLNVKCTKEDFKELNTILTNKGFINHLTFIYVS